MARKRIGELLLEQRAISVAQLEAGLAAHRKSGQRLGATLVAQGAITEATLAGALSQALGLPQVDLSAVTPEWAAVHMLRARFCEQHELFPFALESTGGRRQLVVAMSDPLNVTAVEEIEFTTGLKVSPRVAALSSVRSAILRYYHKVPVTVANAAVTAPAPAARPLAAKA
ncbi:general secretion pathway protein GspE, partial [Pyxidicoccus fallax]|nr:general secretion pathway protein GspE [Pyxidicoccus fallax]